MNQLNNMLEQASWEEALDLFQQGIQTKMQGYCKGQITETVIYQTSQRVYENIYSVEEGQAVIAMAIDLPLKMAKGYILNFLSMMEGKFYTYPSATSITRYFFEQIKKDYPPEFLKKAKISVKRHLEYMESLGIHHEKEQWQLL